MPTPKFPIFEKLRLKHKEELDKVMKNLPPYSDHNFAGIWSYNVTDDIAISELHGNLIFKLRDYLSNEIILSFIGNKKLNKTIELLLKHAKNEGINPTLKLIPKSNFNKQNYVFTKWVINEDRDNFDYIYKTSEISKLKGSKFEKKRNKINKFLNENKFLKYRIVNLMEENENTNLIRVFNKWVIKKGKNKSETNHEKIALQRLLKDSKTFNLLCIGVYKTNSLLGFAITELLGNSYAVFHFVKADPSIKGIYEFIFWNCAKELSKRGYKYMSREQDMGILGLREAKMSWRPKIFLKKYTISLKD
jgi:uncharacterized protein